MERRNRTLLLLTVYAALWLAGPLAGQTAGTHAVLSDYILPQYGGSDDRLQFMLYGDSATNKGALVYLTNPMIDIMNNNIHDLSEITTMGSKEMKPAPYPIGCPQKTVLDFWNRKQIRHSRAWIFSEKAVFDKTTGILRSDDKAFFRSREMDCDGVGFDAYHKRKFIHIRSNVTVVIRPEVRTTMGPAGL